MTISAQPVLVEKQNGVATLTLNRPDVLNAYVPEMGDALVAAFRDAREDESVRVVVLTGAGRAFCAGVDLEALKASYAKPRSPDKPKLGEESFVREWPLEMMEFPKPVIAAINGHAIGVGVTMTLPCDLRIAAEDAKLGLTFAKLGILPGLGSTHLLPRLVGTANALDLVLTSRVILGPEAAAMGLVQACVPRDVVLDLALERAAQMAEADPLVLAAARSALLKGPTLSMADAMGLESKLSSELRAAKGS